MCNFSFCHNTFNSIQQSYFHLLRLVIVLPKCFQSRLLKICWKSLFPKLRAGDQGWIPVLVIPNIQNTNDVSDFPLQGCGDITTTDALVSVYSYQQHK